MFIKKKKIIFLLALFIITPWFNSNYFDSVESETLRQEDSSFYEINTCSVSVAEFIFKNPKSIYQDHYFFKFDNNTSISCFGRISGVSLDNSGFYISVGASPLVSLILQSIVWMLFISFMPKSKNLKLFNLNQTTAVLFTAYLFAFSIYAEQRFYSNTIFSARFNDKKFYLVIFILLLWVCINLIYLVTQREEKIIEYFPYMFLFSGLFLGTNFSIFLILIVYFGIISVLNKKYLIKFNKLYILFTTIWLFNSSGSYYFQPGKLRGFTSSVYEFNSNLFWFLIFFFVYNGVFYLFNEYNDTFTFEKYKKNWSLVAMPILIFGIVGSNFPALNLLFQYLFGLQRNITTESNPFIINEWSEKVSWRGLSPSAETIGEFFALSIIFVLIGVLKNQNSTNKLNITFLIMSTFGLYFSDNRTGIFFVIIFIIFTLFKKFQLNKKFAIFSSVIILILLFFLIGFQNLTFPYEFTSTVILNKSLDSKVYYETSSYLDYLINSFNYKNIFSYFFGLFSTLGFILNRAEIWGLFFARFNPTFLELYFGSGPLSFGQLYGEINIVEPNTLLLTHSSLLSYLLFFGYFGILLFFIICIRFIYLNKSQINFISIFMILFLILNIVKNDNLNYFSNFTNYTLLFLFLFRRVKN